MSNDAPATAAVIRTPREIRYDPQNPATLYMDAGAFEQIQRVGRMLANSNLVPDHLRSRWGMVDGKSVCVEDRSGDCSLIFCQALRWGLDPLAVAQATYVVKGKLGYEGKLIAGLVNTSGRTEGSLRYEFTGEGDSMAVRISARLSGETEDRETVGTFTGWHTTKDGKVSDQWRPGQRRSMLRYRGAREWAREHMPELLLGIQAREDLEDAEEREAVDTVRVGDTHVPVNAVVEKLRQQAAAPGCAHPEWPASALAFVPATETRVCERCGVEFRGTAEPEKAGPGEPGLDEEPVLTSAAAKPAKREPLK